mgnify:CR=1 FL=1
MKKTIYFIPLILLLNCSTEESSEKKIIIDPNPTSEMAQLMRDMTNELASIRERLINEEDLDQNLLNFALIHEQEVTDPSFQKPHIQPMSEAYAYAVDAFNENPTKSNYTAIINNCLSCHQLSCPGPVVRIKKLQLDNNR